MFQSHRPGLTNRYFWLQMTYAESDETWAPLTLRETPVPKYEIDAIINCPHFMIMSQRKLCQVNFYYLLNIHPCIWLYTHEYAQHMSHRVAHQRTDWIGTGLGPRTFQAWWNIVMMQYGAIPMQYGATPKFINITHTTLSIQCQMNTPPGNSSGEQ